MIRLKVEPYCHDCSDFEAHVVRIYQGNGHMYDCTVQCEYRNKCAMIADNIRKFESGKIPSTVFKRGESNDVL